MREKITLKDNMQSILFKMSEGNPRAIRVLMEIMEKIPEKAIIYYLHLDDMNIRGCQIGVGYKDYCHENINRFIKCIKERDKEMVAVINKECRAYGETAIIYGGS